MKVRKKRKVIIVSAVIVSLNVSADTFYVVKKDDTLTSILLANNLKPIYGRRGALAETLKLNPGIGQSEGNKIYPKMKIILAGEKLADEIIKRPGVEEVANIDSSALKKIKANEETVNDRTPSDNFKQSFYWAVSPSLSWKNLSSTDENVYRNSKINALSNTNYGASISYGMHFEESIDIYSKLSLESVSFVQNNSINLLKKKFVASSFSVGVLYEKKWLFEVAMSDDFFLTSPSLSSIDIKKVTLPEIKSTYLKSFYQYREATLSCSLSGNVFLPRTSSEVKSKFSYGAGGALEARVHNQSFSIGYNLNFLKADGNSTNSQNIYWRFNWETL